MNHSEEHSISIQEQKTKIRERYRGTVIGIERDNLPIPNPDVETMIQKGDIICVLGSQRMADSLIKGGILKDK